MLRVFSFLAPFLVPFLVPFPDSPFLVLHIAVSAGAMFADVTEFKLINANIPDICLTQLTTLQNYLRTIHKRNEIDDTIYSEIKPQSSRPARAHGLPKTHKAFDSLPPFRPIIDTTGTAYEGVAKYLSKLLFLLTLN